MGDNYVKDYVELGLAPDLASAQEAIQSLHPMGYGTVEDVACAVLYLASGAARWVNGSELVLDGGLTAQ
jgi:NAD(P)-dependent dehydrogenase (short-subunit alcohol dehydrogenase family)